LKKTSPSKPRQLFNYAHQEQVADGNTAEFRLRIISS
jgi:hypothetical protein